MADDDRLGGQAADDPGVVLDDVLNAFPATRSGCRRVSSTVSAVPGQPGATGA